MQENKSSRHNSVTAAVFNVQTTIASRDRSRKQATFLSRVPVHCITPFCSDALVSPPNLYPPWFGAITPEYLLPSQWVPVLPPIHLLHNAPKYGTKPSRYVTLHFRDGRAAASHLTVRDREHCRWTGSFEPGRFKTEAVIRSYTHVFCAI